jgi:hypothetical protein
MMPLSMLALVATIARAVVFLWLSSGFGNGKQFVHFASSRNIFSIAASHCSHEPRMPNNRAYLRARDATDIPR